MTQTYLQLFEENQRLRRELEDLKTKEFSVHGWKGESGIDIEKSGNIFICREWRKSKESGDIDESVHKIPKRNVQVLWAVIKHNTPINHTKKYKKIVEELP